MVRKILIILVLFVLLAMPVILATTTTINVKTLANYDVEIKTLDPNPNEDKSDLLEYFEPIPSNDGGFVSFESHTSKNTISIVVIVRKDGKAIEINGKKIHKFENYPTGGIINLEVKEKPPEPEINKTNETGANEIDVAINVNENETEEDAEKETETEEIIEESEEKRGITGAFIGTGKIIATSKITYFIIIGIVVVFAIFFIVKKKLKSKGHYIDFKIKDDKGDKPGYEPEGDKRLEDAEKKIKEAKEELDDIKNRKSKLQEAKGRFERDKEELKRLEGED